MKKGIFAFIAVIIAIAAIFYFGRKEEPSEKKTFETYVSEDYAYSESMEKAYLYEVETVLNGAIDTLSPDNVKVVSMTTVIGHRGEVIFIERNLENEIADTVVVKGTWVGSCRFEQGVFPYSLSDALNILHECGAELPASDKMTLRKPLDAYGYEHPMYIFGQMNTGFIYVDAVTGETGRISEMTIGSLEEVAEDSITEIVSEIENIQ